MAKEDPRRPGVVPPGRGNLFSFTQNPNDYKAFNCEQKVEAVSISNGLDWSLDNKTFYYIGE